MFLQTQRMSGKGSEITIIEPSQYEVFFQWLKDNQALDLEFKAFLSVLISGGCRISEVKSIRSGDIDTQGHFRVKVLKKRTEEPIYRPCILCPVALSILNEYRITKSLSDFDILFKKHRSTLHRQIKKHFGKSACSHSIGRHSHISFLLHNLHISTELVAVEMRMLTHVVDSYNHANVQIEQLTRFKKAV